MAFGANKALFKAGLILDADNTMGSAINEAEDQVLSLRQKTVMLGQSIEDTGQRFQAAGQKMMATGAALSAPLIGAATSFAEFESKMNRSMAVFGDVTEEMRDQMAERAREISDLTKGMVASEEAAEGFEFLASAGLEAEQAIAAIEPTARFSQAAQMDLSEATSRLTNAQSALGLSAEDPTENMKNMKRVSDALVGAYQTADATVDQFSEALTNKAAARLRSMNVEVEEGTALLAGFADQGIKGSKAGERLNILLRDLPKAARENSQAFEQMGISLFDAEGELRDGADIIGQFEDAVGDLPPQQREAALAQLGLNQRVSDSLTTLLGTSEKIRQFEKDIRESTGATEDLAKSQERGLKVAFGNVMEQADNLGEVLGEMNSGPLVGLLDWTANAINAARQWAKENEGTAATLSQLVGGLGATVFAAGAATSALGFFLSGIGKTIKLAPKAWDKVTTLASGIKTAATATWAGVRATGAWIASQWKSLTSTIANAGGLRGLASTAYKRVVGGLSTAATATWSWIASQWSSLTATIANAGGLRALATAAAGKLVKGMRAAAVATKAFTVSLLTNPVTLVAAAAAGAAVLIIKNWDTVKNFFLGYWEDIKPHLQPVIDFFKDAWKWAGRVTGAFSSFLGLAGDETTVQMEEMQTVQVQQEQPEAFQQPATLPPGLRDVTPERMGQAQRRGREEQGGVLTGLLNREEQQPATGEEGGPQRSVSDLIRARQQSVDVPVEASAQPQRVRPEMEVPQGMSQEVTVDAPSSIPVDAPSSIPVGATEPIPVDAPGSIPVEAPSSIPVDAPDSIPIEMPSALEESIGVRPELQGSASTPAVPDQTMGILPQLRGPVPTPSVEDQTAPIRPQVEGSPSLPPVEEQTMGILPQLQGTVPTPGIEEQAAPIRPEVRGAVPSVEPGEKTFSIRPQMEGGLSLPSIPDQGMGIRPELRGAVPSVETGEQRLPLRPDLEGAVPTPEPATTEAPAKRAVREVVGIQQGQEQKQAAETRRTEVTVRNEVNVEVNGDPDAEEVQEGVEAGLSNVNFEKQMRRVLDEERRTGF